jgi:hypothetical protein
MLTILIAFAALVAILVAFFLVYGRAETWRLVAGDPDLGQFDRSAPARSEQPNDALFCTPGLCEGVPVDRELPEYTMPPGELIERIVAAMDEIAPVAERVDDGGDPAQARFVTYTEALRFPDTNSFEAVTLGDGRTGLVAYARAQLGKSDVGNNRKRLEAIVSGIDR